MQFVKSSLLGNAEIVPFPDSSFPEEQFKDVLLFFDM